MIVVAFEMFVLGGPDNNAVLVEEVTVTLSPRTPKYKRRQLYVLIAFAASFTADATTFAFSFMHRSRSFHLNHLSTSYTHHHANRRGMHNHHHLYEGADGLHPLSELRRTSYDALLKGINPSVQIVLIGEGTHGTEEFFRIRSEVTQCLLQCHGFSAILCEGDVQPFFELNEFVTSHDQSFANIKAAKIQYTNNEYDDTKGHIKVMLSRLFCHRFPDWMWSNTPMVDLISWLKEFNCKDEEITPPVQILGMDIQSPFTSMDYIIQQLTAIGEGKLATMTQECYEPLFGYRNKIRDYGNDVYGNRVTSQENAVKKALNALLEKYEGKNLVHSDGCIDDIQELKVCFQMVQNAHAIVASEAYHRQRIYPGHTTTWNIRTNSMLGSIQRSMELVDRLKRRRLVSAASNDNEVPPVRLVVWAHNSHVGDMRSTGYSSLGQVSLGQLCRETFGEDNVFLIGMTTYEGSVRASHADRQGACWKGDGEVMPLKKAIDDSHESVLHSVAMNAKSICGEQAFGLHLLHPTCGDEPTAANSLGGSEEVIFNCNRAERFVGSCYLPQTELMSHYSQCNMATQFDYVFHVDKSTAITA